MTKKDYISFAEMIVDLKKKSSKSNIPECNRDEEVSINEVEIKITDILRADNPLFSLMKWNDYKEKIS